MISSADLRRHAAGTTSDASHLLNMKCIIKQVATAIKEVEPSSPAPTAGAAATSTATRIVKYRHDPYSYKPVTSITCKTAADQSFLEAYDETNVTTPLVQVMTSAGFALPVPASKARAAQARRNSQPLSKSVLESSLIEEGVSEVSSENDVTDTMLNNRCRMNVRLTASSSMVSPNEGGLSPDLEANAVGFASALELMMVAPVAPAPHRSSVIRYASVNFRFGSAWFIAPFRTAMSDLVVVEYPANNSLHMGIVSAITTTKPSTFYSPENPNPDTLTDEELASLPRLLRHARDFDKETKLDLRTHDLRSLQAARQLAEEISAPIQFLDAEWLLDLSAVTYLVNVYGDKVELVNRLADEIASAEGAEVVFTYPSAKQRY